MAQTQWLAHVTVAAVIQQDNRFLLVEEFSGERLVWNQPAGHLEDNESIIEAVKRETLEETGWKFEPEYLVGIYRWKHSGDSKTYLRFAFGGQLGEQVSKKPLDNDIQGIVWKYLHELECNGEKLRSPQVLATINDYLAGQRYPLSLLQNL
ncbi:MAG: NUDIX hydrolase [Arenicellales bacterium WSBS_2016_MAG_OTU3]